MKTNAGYFFTVALSGEWALTATGALKRNASAPTAARMLARGTLQQALGLKRWHRLSLGVSGCSLDASIDGVVVVEALEDTGCDPTSHGWAAVGTGWHDAQIKAVTVKTDDSNCSVPVTRWRQRTLGTFLQTAAHVMLEVHGATSGWWTRRAGGSPSCAGACQHMIMHYGAACMCFKSP